jgi:hypothetical protein
MKSLAANRILYAALLFGAILLCGATTHTTAQSLHPKLVSGKTVVRRVMILPPRVEFTRQSVKGGESMIEESEQVAKALVATLGDIFKEKQIVVVGEDGAALTQPPANDETLEYSLADAQRQYDALLPKMLKKTKDIKKGRYTLGDQVGSLAPGGDIDAFIFVRAFGSKPTKGKRIFGLLQLSPAFPLVIANIGVVDARTGEVLLLAKPLALGDATGDADKVLRKPLAKSLKKLPVAR